jgi:hypothetical protein
MSGEQRKAVIKNADMDEKMQQDAVDIASKALSEYNIEKVSLIFVLSFMELQSLTWFGPLIGCGGIH